MTRLSKSKEVEIRNRLDEIGARMYHDVVVFDDIHWSHKTINELLFIIYTLQEWEEDG